jgi:hypothetical protein
LKDHDAAVVAFGGFGGGGSVEAEVEERHGNGEEKKQVNE